MSVPSASSSVEHWAYQVQSPLREPAQIRELASGQGRSLPAGDAWGEMLQEFEAEQPTDEDEFDPESEFEAYDGFEPSTEADAYDGEAFGEADLLEEAEAAEHPLASVFSLPRLAFDAMAKGDWATAIAIAVGAGQRDVNQLTNMVFWFRHPQLIGQKLRADQVDLAREWVQIRDGLVKPALAGRASSQPPGQSMGQPRGTPAPRPVSAGGRTAIPADGLRWFGPTGEETPELMAFMRNVYDHHVRRSAQSGAFVDTLPGTALDDVEPGKKARADAAAKAREMLAAAHARLAAGGLTGSVRIGVLSAYRSADLQFDIWQGKTTKGAGGFPHYYEKTKATRRLPKYGGEHSDKAAAHLAQYMGGYVAAPGYSNHQDGLALDLGTRKGKGGLIKLYEGSWFHNWLKANARSYHFEPLATEAWHWVYRPPKGTSETEVWTHEVVPTAVPAGRLEVPKVAVLASHRGHGPDLVLRWNDMPTVPAEIDVVVHLHGYSWASMTLPKHIEVWSGLDLGPVDGAAGAGRTRPTLTVLPRGHFTGVQVGRIYRYTFPALTTKDGLNSLLRESLKQFSQRVGGLLPKVGRLILTAHSGGGAPLMQILRRHDPHEVYVFDGLYQDATPLAEWAARHIKADRQTLEGGAAPNGAMRVFFGPSTKGYSVRLDRALAGGLQHAPALVRDRYRVEASRLGHWQIARQYGWRMLTDPAADVPDAARPGPGKAAVQREDEVGPGDSPLPPSETWSETDNEAWSEAGDAEYEWEFDEVETEGREDLEELATSNLEDQLAPWAQPEDEVLGWAEHLEHAEFDEDEDVAGELDEDEDVAGELDEDEYLAGELDEDQETVAAWDEALDVPAGESSDLGNNDEEGPNYESVGQSAPPRASIPTSWGGFGEELRRNKAMSEGEGAARAIALLKKSSTFDRIARRIGAKYRSITQDRNAWVRADARYNGKRFLDISGSAGAGGSFNPNEFPFTDSIRIAVVNQADMPRVHTQQLAHEVSHAWRFLSRPAKPRDLWGAIQAAIDTEEVQARLIERKILNEIRKADRDAPKFETASTDPKRIERQVSGLMLTYLEGAVLYFKLDNAAKAEHLSAREAKDLQDEVGAAFPAPPIRRSQYGRTWFKILKAQEDWRQFQERFSPEVHILERDRLANQHARTILDREVMYRS